MSHKRLVVMLLVITLVGSTSAPTAISAPAPPNIISRGPTEIPHGITLHQDDITMANEFLAVTIAVGTTPWFDIPRGSIMDATVVVDGEYLRTRTYQFDFCPHNWYAWPNTYSNITIVENTPAGIPVSRRDPLSFLTRCLETHSPCPGAQISISLSG